jgi:hypothetical protein
MHPNNDSYIHIQSCSFFYFNSLLLKVISLLITLLVPHVTTNYWTISHLLETYLLYRLWALCLPIYYGALCSHYEPCARQLCYYYLLTLSHYYSFNLWFICRSYQCIDAYRYLNLRFIRWSSQLLDALVLKPQFIRWSPQFTDALVPKPLVFLLTDSYHTTIYSCKQHHIHNFNQNMINILNAKHHAYN